MTWAEKLVLYYIYYYDIIRNYQKIEKKDYKGTWTSIHTMGIRMTYKHFFFFTNHT